MGCGHSDRKSSDSRRTASASSSPDRRDVDDTWCGGRAKRGGDDRRAEDAFAHYNNYGVEGFHAGFPVHRITKFTQVNRRAVMMRAAAYHSGGCELLSRRPKTKWCVPKTADLIYNEKKMSLSGCADSLLIEIARMLMRFTFFSPLILSLLFLYNAILAKKYKLVSCFICIQKKLIKIIYRNFISYF